jgi:LysR family transcriptional activator of glutamate synthase operon
MKQLNLEQLEYVVEVAKTGSLSKAAQRYYVSLPAVSQAISILEAELWGLSSLLDLG